MLHSSVVLGTSDRLCTVSGVPHSVEPAILVCPLICVAAEEVSLGLNQVGREPCTPDAVKVTQRCCHAWCAEPCKQVPLVNQDACMAPVDPSAPWTTASEPYQTEPVQLDNITQKFVEQQ